MPDLLREVALNEEMLQGLFRIFAEHTSDGACDSSLLEVLSGQNFSMGKSPVKKFNLWKPIVAPHMGPFPVKHAAVSGLGCYMIPSFHLINA